MPFALDGGATSQEIIEALNYVLANLSQTTATNAVNGQITDSTGQIVGYLYKYVFVKYADSFDGTVNFSNSPTNRLYYGIRNSDSSTESTNPADYIWTKVTGGFGTTKFLWYLTIGGRQIQWQVATALPNPGWAQDPGTAIDLDIILGSTKNPSNYIINRVPNNNAAPTDAEVVTAIGRYPISGDLCTIVYNNGQNSTLWRYTTGWSIYIKYITGDIISTNSVLTNTLQVGTTPAISGSTMTGSGAIIKSDGTFALGNSSSNIVFNGTNAYINGFTAANMIAYSPPLPVAVTAGASSFTFNSGESPLTGFDPAKPINVIATVNLTVGASTYLNSNCPQAMIATIYAQYAYSTNNGASYTAWTGTTPMYIKDLSDNSTSIAGYDRNFQGSASTVNQINLPLNTTNVKFRISTTVLGKVNRDWTTAGSWASSSNPYVGLDLSYLNLLAFQVKV